MADFTQTQLEAMGLKDLQAAFEQSTGKASKTPNKKYLIKSILDVQKDNSQQRDVEQQSEKHDARLAAATSAKSPVVLILASNDQPEPNTTFGVTAEQREITSAANRKSLKNAQDKLNAKPATDQQAPESQEQLRDGADNAESEPVDEFAGMTPKDFLERAKARGKELVKASKQQAPANDEPANAKRAKSEPKESDGLTDMDATALQALYLKEIGRATGSTNVGYLIWKIREARKGNIKVGPAKERAPKSDKPVKVIPIRIEEDALAAMDELIGDGKPYSSRMDIIRMAIIVWAERAGHSELYTIVDGHWGQ